MTALSLLITGLLAQATDPSLWTHQQKEDFLLSARVVRTKYLSQGITHSQRANLEKDGIAHDAHIQTIDEYKAQFQGTMNTEMNFKDTYKFNIVAYKLDRLMDLNMIPVTVERRVGGKDASVTWWIDEAWMTEMERTRQRLEPPSMSGWNQQMWILRVFDQLIANTDRNLGNVVICKNWDLWMIDHTRAFRIRTDLIEKKNLEKCDRTMLERLRKLDRSSLQAAMKNHLTSMEINGLLARRDRIVSFFDEQVKLRGEDPVLYDYLGQRQAKYGR